MINSKEFTLSKDGNMWCFLWGNNLQNGIAGFGKNYDEVMESFMRNFAKDFFNLKKIFTPESIVFMSNTLEEWFGDEYLRLFKWDEYQEEYWKLYKDTHD